jgi:2-methylcitrate dehydratase PrpD
LDGDAKPELLTQAFGKPFRMVDPGVGFKKHPSNYFTHRPIDAALALREEFSIAPTEIVRVEVIFPRFDYVNRPVPATGLDGKFSVQYATLVALLDGEITIDSFTNERRFAPDVEALLPQVTLTVDDTIPSDFDQMHTIVNVWLKDGQKLSKRVDKLSGWIGSPLTRDQRLKKFFGCTRRTLAESQAKRMLTLVEELDTLADVTELMSIARCDR